MTATRSLVEYPSIDREVAASEVLDAYTGVHHAAVTHHMAVGDALRLAETIESRSAPVAWALVGRPLHVRDRASWWPVLLAACEELCADARRRFDSEDHGPVVRRDGRPPAAMRCPRPDDPEKFVSWQLLYGSPGRALELTKRRASRAG